MLAKTTLSKKTYFRHFTESLEIPNRISYLAKSNLSFLSKFLNKMIMLHFSLLEQICRHNTLTFFANLHLSVISCMKR